MQADPASDPLVSEMASSCLESVAAVPTTATTTILRQNVSKESEISSLPMKDQKGILAKAEGEWHDEVLQIWTPWGVTNIWTCWKYVHHGIHLWGKVWKDMGARSCA